MPIAELRVDASDLDEARKALLEFGKRGRAVIARALNRTGGPCLTAVRRKVAQRTGAKASNVRAAVIAQRATQGRLYYAILPSKAGLGVSAINPVQDERGTAYGGPGLRRFVPHAFIARMPSGHVGVFIRSKQTVGFLGLNTRLAPRLPIKEIGRPTARIEMLQEDVRAVFEAVASERLADDLIHEIEVEASGVLQNRKRGKPKA